jgi:predicted Zn-dependent protease with MMP-like domain
MSRLNRKKFQEIVESGINLIPRRFLDKLNNMAIVIENKPSSAQIKKLNLRSGWTLFGLYEGVPQARRGSFYGGVLPDKITIFQKPIEDAARDIDDIRKIVKNTVWHEIAHHFGMDENRVRRAEAKRKN